MLATAKSKSDCFEYITLVAKGKGLAILGAYFSGNLPIVGEVRGAKIVIFALH